MGLYPTCMFRMTFAKVGRLTPKLIGSWLVLIVSHDLSSSDPYLEHKCFSVFRELGTRYFVKLTPVPPVHSGGRTKGSGRPRYSRA
jgi:hypothetical protein